MSKEVVLYNRDRRKMFEASMYHVIVCKAEGVCLCQEEAIPGTLHTVRREASFRIPPKTCSDKLPASVLLIPNVAAALAGPMPQLVQMNVQAKVEVIPSLPHKPEPKPEPAVAKGPAPQAPTPQRGWKRPK